MQLKSRKEALRGAGDPDLGSASHHRSQARPAPRGPGPTPGSQGALAPLHVPLQGHPVSVSVSVSTPGLICARNLLLSATSSYAVETLTVHPSLICVLPLFIYSV